MINNFNNSIKLLLLTLLVWGASLTTALCEEQKSGSSIEDANNDTSYIDTNLLSDGPHIYWRSSGEAVVFYLCNGELKQREFEASNSIKFYGLCDDSLDLYVIPSQKPEIGPQIFEDVSRIIAISDLHGEYDYMVHILIKSGVIDENRHWIWGDGHLVINGDTFDRGSKVTECLWLIYKLELEAFAQGGRVHYLLGNHELMVMQNDLRYVNEKYFDGIVKEARISYDKLFGPRTELGRWLRSKHSIILINNILFVHGGLHPDMATRYKSLDEINKAARRDIDSAPFLKKFGGEEKFLYGTLGPFWYRGFLMEHKYPQMTEQQIEDVLHYFNAESVVIGHSETDSVMSHYGGLVFSIDVPVEELHSLQALLWEDGEFYRVTGDGEKQALGD